MSEVERGAAEEEYASEKTALNSRRFKNCDNC